MRRWVARLLGDDGIAIQLGPGLTRGWSLGGRTLEVPSPTTVARTFRPPWLPRATALPTAEATIGLVKEHLHLRRLGPRVLACARTDATPEERTDLVRAFERAGAREVHIVPEPLAAAVGVGIDISSPYAQLLVDVGETSTDGAVVANGELVASFSERIGSDALHTALRRHLLAQHALRVDDEAAAALVRLVGVRQSVRGGEYVRVAGRDLRERPKKLWLSRREAHAALEPVVGRILDAVERGVRALPEQTGAEVIESGLCLTGAGAQVRGVAERLAEKTGIDARVPADPLRAAIRGAHRMLHTLAGPRRRAA